MNDDFLVQQNIGAVVNTAKGLEDVFGPKYTVSLNPDIQRCSRSSPPIDGIYFREQSRRLRNSSRLSFLELNG